VTEAADSAAAAVPPASPGGVALPRAPGESRNRIWVERADVNERLRHEAGFLLIAAGIIVVSFLLPTLKSHHAWVNIPCIFYKATRVPCLICGMTRSFVFTAHGNFYSAFNMHLLGPAMFLGTSAIAAYLAFSVATGYRVRYTLSRRARRIAFWSVLGIFLLCWGIKIAFMRGSW
jgi:hypothetical protein